MLATDFIRFARWQALPLLWLLLATTGCEMPPANTLHADDFEEAGHQQPIPPGIFAGIAHSGEYASRLDPNTHYGAGWNAAWGDIGQPHKIRVQAWAFLPNGRLKGAFVMEVKRGETLHSWQSFDIHQVVKRYNQWEAVHHTFVLPRDLEAADQIRCYVWNYSGDQTWYVDDVAIERIE